MSESKRAKRREIRNVLLVVGAILFVLTVYEVFRVERHVAVLVKVVDATTGAPVDAVATPHSDDNQFTDFPTEAKSAHLVMWFGDFSIEATITADGYHPQTVELDVGETTVKLVPIHSPTGAP